MIVHLLRWLFGYYDISVEGKFTERFINLAARKGVNMWKLRNINGCICFCTGKNEWNTAQSAAEKTQNSIHIVKEHGLPYILAKHKHRSGLLAGAVLFAVFCKVMSCFVWSISYQLPEIINEYEMQEILSEYGFHEGAYRESLNVQDIIDKISLKDNRISWMTINIIGSCAEVRVSPDTSQSLNRRDISQTSNMISAADGTVTRIKVKNGSSKISVGDAIKKGQMLVSGVMEYNDGTNVIVDSNAQVFAKTARSAEIKIPKNIEVPVFSDSAAVKSEIVFFGIKLPFSIQDTPDCNNIKTAESEQLTFLDSRLPLYINSEILREYTKKPVVLDRQQAETILKNKLSLYEVFMLGSTNQGTVLQKKISFSESSDSYILKADYEIEEDVCIRMPLKVVSGDSQD